MHQEAEEASNPKAEITHIFTGTEARTEGPGEMEPTIEEDSNRKAAEAATNAEPMA